MPFAFWKFSSDSWSVDSHHQQQTRWNKKAISHSMGSYICGTKRCIAQMKAFGKYIDYFQQISLFSKNFYFVECKFFTASNKSARFFVAFCTFWHYFLSAPFRRHSVDGDNFQCGCCRGIKRQAFQTLTHQIWLSFDPPCTFLLHHAFISFGSLTARSFRASSRNRVWRIDACLRFHKQNGIL